MRKAQRKKIARYVRTSQYRSVWRKIVQFMACIVVFCTTYALILPAITAEKKYFCGMEAHEHGEGCYIQEVTSRLVCEQPEGEGHTHGDACLDEAGAQICTVEEQVAHQHEESCYTLESVQVLQCKIAEHIHENACASDPNADLENAQKWESTLDHVEISGDWSKDLMAIASTQLGYTESEKNYLAEEGRPLQGYTRYGAWYGIPYGRWDSMFLSFCLNYAEIPREAIAWGSDSEKWLKTLQNNELTANAMNKVPEAGDLLFYREDKDSELRTAIILKRETGANPEEILLRIIEGDRDHQVVQRKVELKDIVLENCCGIAQVQTQWDAIHNPTEPVEEIGLEETGTTAATEAEEEKESIEPTEPVEEIEVTEPTEPATETEVTQPTEPATETEVTESTEPATETEPEQPAETPQPPQILSQTKETENYIVTVTYPENLALPDGAELRVVEYPKDSDIFRQRCEEAGYELDWLLNIGFFLEEEELSLDGAFDVLVTSKQGHDLGQDITHFSDAGAERITGEDVSETAEDGQTAVAFSSDSFSDFGGGVARAASDGTQTAATGEIVGFQFVTANPNQLKANTDYVIYTGSGTSYNFMSAGLSSVRLNGSDGNSPYQVGRSWSVNTNAMGTNQINDMAWRVEFSGSNYYLRSMQSNNYLQLNNGWSNQVSRNDASRLRNTSVNGAAVQVGNGTFHIRYEDNTWKSTWHNDNYSYWTSPTTIYFAEVTPIYATAANYPDPVYTGSVHVDRLRFYNICEGDANGISALPGCVFEVQGTTSGGQKYSTTIVSGNSPQIALPSNIPDGVYTITEVSAPEGYMRDLNNVREFWIEDGALVSEHNVGIFLNHELEQLTVGKTGEVEDYNNRIYQILLNAKSNLRLYSMDPIEVLFVVDKSNSMLFPSGMNETGKTITLRADGQNNVRNNQNVLNSLDKNVLHYIIADPNGSSTVYAIWHDGSAWLYQDASYYVKAKFDNGTGYESSGETVIFPGDRSYGDQSSWEDNTYGTEYRSNGGGLNHSIVGSTLGTYIENNGGTVTFQLYTAKDQYNRLHYMEEALANMIYELADANHQNRVVLIPFTKEVQTQIYYPVKSQNVVRQPVTLTTSNAEMLFDIVTHIDTSGGTRQDLALEYAYETYLDVNDGFDKAHTYTILITDGAPVRSGSSAPPLGSPNSSATTAENGEIYGRIKGWGSLVRSESTLMTVALGMEHVEGGKAVLQQIASDDEFYCALDDASTLTDSMQRILFDGMRDRGQLEIDNGYIVDEISDSFYPIAWTDRNTAGRTVLTRSNGKTWLLLEEGDWITLDGKITTANASDAAGQFLRRDDGTGYIQWQNQTLSGNGWNGTFYVKAKEDFIGGNAIDTNKDALVTVNDATKHMETPTVNVHLLGLNQNSSEVTVYLGDTINSDDSSPRDVLREFYNQIGFTKVQDESSITELDLMNRLHPDADATDGLERSFFYLKYALGYQSEDGTWVPRNLTDDEWATLEAGGSLTFPYVYDDASSHGNVGYFTITMTKDSETYQSHPATQACQPNGQPLTENCDHPVETYTLNVTYTAYELGEQGRPESNRNNGSGSPGTEVCRAATSLNWGQGIITSENVHEVHVISGRIVVRKVFAENAQWNAGDSFTFLLTDQNGTVQSRTVTIDGRGTATVQFDNLPRGTYTVTEAVHEDYAVKSVTVGADTNSYYDLPDPAQVTFTMGNNLSNQNVIGKAHSGDRFTSYIDPVNGVYGEAIFTNAPRIFTGEIHVEKIWDDGNDKHDTDSVYLALYLDDQPVLDTDRNARLIRLDAASGWKGTFTVILTDANDSVDNYNYSVREVGDVSDTALLEWHPAILENDGETILYYNKALEEGGLLGVSGKGYIVQYSRNGDGTYVVTNLKGYDMPETGGTGTHWHMIGGLAMILAALMYGYSLRRKRERGASR